VRDLPVNQVEQLLAEFDEAVPRYRALSRKIAGALAASCKREKIHIHAIDQRVKSRDSLVLKINRPGASYDTLQDLTDISGVRVITYYASDVDKVAELIQQDYEVDRENSIDKGALLDPDRFGYLSLHYVVRLKGRGRGRSNRMRLTGLKAEIQVRSILQHAWAEIEHDLGYKSKHAVPRKARRTFSRLSGLLELADQEFDSVLNGLKAYAREIESESAAEVTIDRISLVHFIQNGKLVQALDERIQRRVERELVFEDWFAESLVDKLHFVGVQTISSLEREMERLSKITESMAVEHLQERAYTRTHQGVSIYYFCTTFLAESSSVDLVQEYLEKFGVGEPTSRRRIAESIIAKYADLMPGP
jgi:ppGpp synthetase/RelA/SpoT-type nucleotidyltranferase